LTKQIYGLLKVLNKLRETFKTNDIGNYFIQDIITISYRICAKRYNDIWRFES